MRIRMSSTLLVSLTPPLSSVVATAALNTDNDLIQVRWPRSMLSIYWRLCGTAGLVRRGR